MTRRLKDGSYLVSAELFKGALLRIIPIPENQKAVIGALFHSRDWMSARDLASKAGVEERSLGGIIGGIGLRLSGTRGCSPEKVAPLTTVHGLRSLKFLS